LSRLFPNPSKGGCCTLRGALILRLVLGSELREMIGMLHWKVKLAHVAVVAALLAAFLSDLEGWAW